MQIWNSKFFLKEDENERRKSLKMLKTSFIQLILFEHPLHTNILLDAPLTNGGLSLNIKN